MKYETFKYLIIQKLNEQLEDPKKIALQKIVRNNGQELDALIIMENQMNVAPTIYLNHFYEQYQKGFTFSETFEELLRTYEKNRPSYPINASFFTDFLQIKDRIVYKIINYEMNHSLLEEIPHFRFLDLAIVFYCLICSDDSGNASILIHDNHLKYWNVTADQLMNLAKKNTPVLLPYEIKNMYHILSNEFSIPTSDTYPMFVLTNSSRLNGAGCILYKDLLRQFSEKMNSDLYILPSSVHEVILIPAPNKDSILELSEMVKEVNATEVAEDELLSEHAYYYSRADNSVSM